MHQQFSEIAGLIKSVELLSSKTLPGRLVPHDSALLECLSLRYPGHETGGKTVAASGGVAVDKKAGRLYDKKARLSRRKMGHDTPLGAIGNNKSLIGERYTLQVQAAK